MSKMSELDIGIQQGEPEALSAAEQLAKLRQEREALRQRQTQKSDGSKKRHVSKARKTGSDGIIHIAGTSSGGGTYTKRVVEAVLARADLQSRTIEIRIGNGKAQDDVEKLVNQAVESVERLVEVVTQKPYSINIVVTKEDPMY